MSRNQNWSFLRQDKNKNTWLFSSLLDLQYVHRTLKQTLAPCGPQVARVYFSFLWTCWRLNKLEKGQVGKLVQHHQNISNPLLDQFKDGAIFQAWFKNKIPNLSQGQQLRSGVVEKLIFQWFSWQNVLWTKKSVFCFWLLKLVFCYSMLTTKHKLL